MRKSLNLKVRWYAACLIDINKYLALLPRTNISEKLGGTELNEILINSVPNILSKQAYVQIFDCELITLNKAVNMFEHMEISESIYEVVVEPSHKQSTRVYDNRVGYSRKKIGEASLSHTYSKMSDRYGKHRKIYVDHLKGESKTCLIHCLGH